MSKSILLKFVKYRLSNKEILAVIGGSQCQNSVGSCRNTATGATGTLMVDCKSGESFCDWSTPYVEKIPDECNDPLC